jgi:hypothetical protein
MLVNGWPERQRGRCSRSGLRSRPRVMAGVKTSRAGGLQLHRVGQCNLINMVALGFGVTIAVGPPPRVAAGGIVPVPLAGRNVVPLYAVWMEANPNPALKRLLNILSGS